MEEAQEEQMLEERNQELSNLLIQSGEVDEPLSVDEVVNKMQLTLWGGRENRPKDLKTHIAEAARALGSYGSGKHFSTAQ